MRTCVPILALCTSVALLGCDTVALDVGGEPIPTSMLNGQILVEPAVLDFGDVEVGQEGSLPLMIQNTGVDELIIDEMTLTSVTGNGSFRIDNRPWQMTLAPQQDEIFTVTYTPTEDGDALANLIILSDDIDTPEIWVPINGGCDAPRLKVSPPVVSFEDLPVGCPQAELITLHNVGNAPLVVHGVDFQPTSDDFRATGLPLSKVTLEKNEWMAFTVYYEPETQNPNTAYFEVRSNDPTSPETNVMVTGEAHFSDEVADIYEQQTPYSTDLLLVVDNSCSMSDHQQTLMDNVESFLAVLEGYAPDYHIAVVTTDDAVFHGNVPYLTPETPDANAQFEYAVDVGTMGSGTERGLAKATEALTSTLADSGGPNHGFLREDGALRILILGDEDDQSPGDVSDYVTALQSLKTDHSMVMISSVAASEYGCDPAPRYEQAVSMTEGLSESICTDQWTSTMTSPLWLAEGLETTFDLGGTPVDDTLEVHLNGVLMTEGWDYDSTFNRIEFDEDHIPHAGDEIGLHYNPLGCSN